MSSSNTVRARVRVPLQRVAIATLAVCVIGVGGLIGAASAANDSFEAPVVNGSHTTYVANQAVPLFEWSIKAGTIDHGKGPAGTVCANSGGQCVDLNGISPGWIEQAFPTSEGGKCTVSFQMSHHKNLTAATLYPTMDGLDQAPVSHNTPGVNALDGKWEWRSLGFVAAGPTTKVGFRSPMAGAAGPQIDNVSVGCRPTGILKVCKVAGALVPVGQPFTFSADNGTSFTVPAGPAPGG